MQEKRFLSATTMTQKTNSLSAKIALYEPDIPQNTAAFIRTCSCLGAIVEIIEPCGLYLMIKDLKELLWITQMKK